MAANPSQTSADRTATTLFWGLFGVGYLTAYFLSTAIATPVIWYYPVERHFAFEYRPHGLAADFYGRLLLSLFSGFVVASIGRLVVRRTATERSERWLTPVLAWSAALLLFTASLYIYLLVGRVPFPAPLPPGYVPR
jgi:small-conductance mechanosensitive channel